MKSSDAVLARLARQPLAIASRALGGLLARDAGPPGLRGDASVPDRGYALTESGIAVLPVLGPLMARSDWLTAFFGAISYGEVGGVAEAAFADPATRAVLLELDSPGGEVGGLFDLVDRLSALRRDSGKPLWAVASESALSAAYAIASAADRLYVTRTAEVGSVGVVAVHIDESAADAMAGLKWTLIHAGAKKTDGNPHEPLSGPAFADAQADVDTLYTELVDLVARNRAMAPESVRATEAAVYRGQRGIDRGFADRIGTIDQALADLTSELDATRTRVTTSQRNASSPQPTRRTSMATTEDPADGKPADPPGVASNPAPAGAPTPSTPVPVPTSAVATDAAASAESLRAEFAEIAAVAAQTARLGVPVDAAEAMRKGIKPDALRRAALDALAARAEASTVVAASPSPPTAGDSPIVRRARERAAAAAHN